MQAIFPAGILHQAAMPVISGRSQTHKKMAVSAFENTVKSPWTTKIANSCIAVKAYRLYPKQPFFQMLKKYTTLFDY
jgi:hypothetical protein